jgi:peptidoglycan/LPS O-acetylase OafA/YrhL
MIRMWKTLLEIRQGDRRIAGLMGLEVASLAVVSTLHLAGLVKGHAAPYNAIGAGVAEAVIGLVLLWGALMLVSGRSRGRRAAVAATGFAVVGFIFGLTITVQGGDLPDITYHATVLPLLIVTLLLLLLTTPVDLPRRRAAGPTTGVIRR